MPLIFDDKPRRGRRAAPCCDDCAGSSRSSAGPCSSALERRPRGRAAAGVAELLAHADMGDLFGAGDGRRRAMMAMGRAHKAGKRRAAAGLGDIDVSSFVVSQATIDAESLAFDGRVNAWLGDFAAVAARLPKAFVQQVDDFIARWRKHKDEFYFFQTNRLNDLMGFEAEFNKLRARAEELGAASSITAATVTANGKTVDADKIPPGSSWLDGVTTAVKWAGVIAAGAAAVKVGSDLGLFKRIGRAIGGAHA